MVDLLLLMCKHGVIYRDKCFFCEKIDENTGWL